MTDAAATPTSRARPRDRSPVEWLPAEVPPEAAILEGAGLGTESAVLLARRGILDPDEARRFLEPSLDQLHPPSSLPGVDEAVARLLRAREENARVAVVGDYDADGVSGTALLTACLELAEIEARAILPHRMRDGYGFQPQHVERAEEMGCSLIVTVDCGMGSSEAVRVAAERGIDVIVTDHHLPAEELPEALVLVNPRIGATGSSAYANPELCGAGIALKLGVGLLQAVGREPPIHSLLRVACLGTIADLVPLVGENRAIAALGLEALAEPRSPGLMALMEVARVRPPVAAEDVGFRLGPRLNAAGRLDSPDRALELLRTRDPDRARELAHELDHWNAERQSEEKRVVEEARAGFLEVGELPRILVAWNPDWHRGVVGIAAGRLAREFHRPTLLLQEEDGLCTGSGRSIEGIHLHSFLLPFRERLVRFGGHSQAVGLTVEASAIGALTEEFHRASLDWDPGLLVRRHRYELDSGSVSFVRDELYPLLRRFQPFGQSNPAPLLRVGPLTNARAPRLFGNGHLDLMVEDRHGGRIGVQAWHWGDRIDTFEEEYEILGRLGWDDYLSTPSLSLVDARPVAR